MRRAEKTEVVAELKKIFEDSGSVILISFRNINVPEITEVRRKVRNSKGQYRVVKNTLALRATEGTSAEQIKEHFEGPTAIAYTQDDVVALAQVLRDFAKTNSGMSFKAGIVDGHVISDQQVVELAGMASRDQLLGKLAFLLNAPLTRLVMVLRSPVQKMAFILKQLEKKEVKPE
jgi:large subunit ribosomal protein L10